MVITPMMSIENTPDGSFNGSLFDGMYNPDQMEADFDNLPKLSDNSSKIITINEKQDN